MQFIRKLFQTKKENPVEDANAEHAVIVYFRYISSDLGPIFALEDQLESAITKASVGVFDGNEMSLDGGDSLLYMYGSNGDHLFDAVRPILEASPFMKGAKVKIRYGSPRDNVRQREVLIGSQVNL